MQPKDWNKIRNILEEQLAGYIGQDEETVNAKLDALVTSLTGELTANVVKSVQRGVISLSQNKTSATATITAVNTSKAVVLFGGSTYDSNSNYHKSMRVRLELTNSTTVTVTRIGSEQAVTIPYQVVEYY